MGCVAVPAKGRTGSASYVGVPGRRRPVSLQEGIVGNAVKRVRYFLRRHSCRGFDRFTGQPVPGSCASV